MFGYAGGPPGGAAISSLVGFLGFDSNAQKRAPFFVGATSAVVGIAIVTSFMPSVAEIKAAKAVEESVVNAKAPEAGGAKKAAVKTERPADWRAYAAIGFLLLNMILSQAPHSLTSDIHPTQLLSTGLRAYH